MLTYLFHCLYPAPQGGIFLFFLSFLMCLPCCGVGALESTLDYTHPMLPLGSSLDSRPAYCHEDGYPSWGATFIGAEAADWDCTSFATTDSALCGTAHIAWGPSWVFDLRSRCQVTKTQSFDLVSLPSSVLLPCWKQLLWTATCLWRLQCHNTGGYFSSFCDLRVTASIRGKQILFIILSCSVMWVGMQREV